MKEEKEEISYLIKLWKEYKEWLYLEYGGNNNPTFEGFINYLEEVK